MKRKLLLTLGFLILASASLWAQGRLLKGRVLDDKAQPVPFATVLVKGTNKGTTADLNGEFSIMVEASDSVLVFSFASLSTKEVSISAGQDYVEVTLLPQILEEVEILDYGFQSVSAIKNNASSAQVESRAFQAAPVASFDQLIQGRAAGVMVLAGSGQPGSSALVRIRGFSSISAGSDPLYIIDGVASRAEDFTQLNPSDIESMNILKDASATAIYGSRATNGVIVITTRRGKEGKTRFDYSVIYGIDRRTTTNFGMMNAREKLDFEIENGLKRYSAAEYERLLGRDTDWAKEFFRTGTQLTHNFSASGGTDKTQFFISTQYFKQLGILPRTDIQRYTVRTNFDFKTSQRGKLSFSLNAGYSTRNFLDVEGGANLNNPVTQAYITNPYEPVYLLDDNNEPILDAKGNKIYNEQMVSGVNVLLQTKQNDNKRDDIRLLGNLRYEHEIVKNLKFVGQLGMDMKYFEGWRYFAKESFLGRQYQPDGLTQRYMDAYRQFNPFTLLSYSKTLKEIHTFDFLLGFEGLLARRYSFSAIATGNSSSKVRNLNDATTPYRTTGTVTQDNGLYGHFFIAKYSYKDRYVFDGSIRRDVSSRFGQNNRAAWFGSVAAAWNVSEEKFWQKLNKQYFSYLKTRISWGVLGNQNGIGDFASKQLYSFSGSYNFQPASAPVNVGNPDLRWERAVVTNLGFDMGFMKKRVEIALELYNKLTTDLLITVPLSLTTGFGSQLQNAAEMRNRGIELTLKTTNVDIKRYRLKWTTTLTYAHNLNTVLKADPALIASGIAPGHPLGSSYYVGFAGVHATTGRPIYYDGQGGMTSNFDRAQPVLGNTWIAPITGGFENRITYGNSRIGSFEVSVFFTFVNGNQRLNNIRFFTENIQFANFNQDKSMLNAWKEPGQITEIPRLVRGETQFTSRLLEDASYVRLRNMIFSYSLPENMLKRAKIRGISVFTQMQNWVTWTKWKGFDPEARDGVEVFDYPVPRTLSFGLNLTL